MRVTGAHNFPAIDRVIHGKAASEAHDYCPPDIMPSLLRYNKPQHPL